MYGKTTLVYELECTSDNSCEEKSVQICPSSASFSSSSFTDVCIVPTKYKLEQCFFKYNQRSDATSQTDHISFKLRQNEGVKFPLFKSKSLHSLHLPLKYYDPLCMSGDEKISYFRDKNKGVYEVPVFNAQVNNPWLYKDSVSEESITYRSDSSTCNCFGSSATIICCPDSRRWKVSPVGDYTTPYDTMLNCCSYRCPFRLKCYPPRYPCKRENDIISVIPEPCWRACPKCKCKPRVRCRIPCNPPCCKVCQTPVKCPSRPCRCKPRNCSTPCQTWCCSPPIYVSKSCSCCFSSSAPTAFPPRLCKSTTCSGPCIKLNRCTSTCCPPCCQASKPAWCVPPCKSGSKARVPSPCSCVSIPPTCCCARPCKRKSSSQPPVPPPPCKKSQPCSSACLPRPRSSCARSCTPPCLSPKCCSAVDVSGNSIPCSCLETPPCFCSPKQCQTPCFSPPCAPKECQTPPCARPPCQSSPCVPPPCRTPPCARPPCQSSPCVPPPCRPPPCARPPCQPFPCVPPPCAPQPRRPPPRARPPCQPFPCVPPPCAPQPRRPPLCARPPCQPSPCVPPPCQTAPCVPPPCQPSCVPVPVTSKCKSLNCFIFPPYYPPPNSSSAQDRCACPSSTSKPGFTFNEDKESPYPYRFNASISTEAAPLPPKVAELVDLITSAIKTVYQQPQGETCCKKSAVSFKKGSEHVYCTRSVLPNQQSCRFEESCASPQKDFSSRGFDNSFLSIVDAMNNSKMSMTIPLQRRDSLFHIFSNDTVEEKPATIFEETSTEVFESYGDSGGNQGMVLGPCSEGKRNVVLESCPYENSRFSDGDPGSFACEERHGAVLGPCPYKSTPPNFPNEPSMTNKNPKVLLKSRPYKSEFSSNGQNVVLEPCPYKNSKFLNDNQGDLVLENKHNVVLEPCPYKNSKFSDDNQRTKHQESCPYKNSRFSNDNQRNIISDGKHSAVLEPCPYKNSKFSNDHQDNLDFEEKRKVKLEPCPYKNSRFSNDNRGNFTPNHEMVLEPCPYRNSRFSNDNQRNLVSDGQRNELLESCPYKNSRFSNDNQGTCTSEEHHGVVLEPCPYRNSRFSNDNQETCASEEHPEVVIEPCPYRNSRFSNDNQKNLVCDRQRNELLEPCPYKNSRFSNDNQETCISEEHHKVVIEPCPYRNSRFSNDNQKNLVCDGQRNELLESCPYKNSRFSNDDQGTFTSKEHHEVVLERCPYRISRYLDDNQKNLVCDRQRNELLESCPYKNSRFSNDNQGTSTSKEHHGMVLEPCPYKNSRFLENNQGDLVADRQHNVVLEPCPYKTSKFLNDNQRSTSEEHHGAVPKPCPCKNSRFSNDNQRNFASEAKHNVVLEPCPYKNSRFSNNNQGDLVSEDKHNVVLEPCPYKNSRFSNDNQRKVLLEPCPYKNSRYDASSRNPEVVLEPCPYKNDNEMAARRKTAVVLEQCPHKNMFLEGKQGVEPCPRKLPCPYKSERACSTCARSSLTDGSAMAGSRSEPKPISQLFFSPSFDRKSPLKLSQFHTVTSYTPAEKVPFLKVLHRKTQVEPSQTAKKLSRRKRVAETACKSCQKAAPREVPIQTELPTKKLQTSVQKPGSAKVFLRRKANVGTDCKCHQTATHEEKDAQFPVTRLFTCQTEFRESSGTQYSNPFRSREPQPPDSCSCSQTEDLLPEAETSSSCVCCKKPMTSKVQNLLDRLGETFCEPCAKISATRFYPHGYTSPEHNCVCYKLVGTGTMDLLKSTLTQLQRMNIYEQLCEMTGCKCGKKRGCTCAPKKNKNGCAYFLKLEDASSIICECKDVPNKLPEVTVKVPVNRCRRPINCSCSTMTYESNVTSSNSLQDYLLVNYPQFVGRAEQRRITLRDAANEREANAETRKLQFLELFENKDVENRDFCKVFNVFLQERLTKPTAQKPSLFSHHEMREMTRRKCKNLPEMKRKKDENKKVRIRTANRILANTFTKRLQKSTLHGRVDIPSDIRVVTY